MPEISSSTSSTYNRVSEETEKWIKIRLFSSTWHIWKQHTVLMKNYDKELGATVEIEEIEPPEDNNPSIRYVSEPHGFCLADGQSYELTAIVPSEAKDRVIELWRKIWREDIDDLDLVREMLDIIYDYDESPIIKVYIDEYETRIEIN